MAHVRKSIRDAITTALTGLTTTGANVYQTRVYPLAENKLPGLAIYTSTEETEYASLTIPRTLIRNATVTVEAYVKGVSGYDDTLDTICKEVELAISADVTLGGLAKDTQITGFTADFNGESEQPVALGVIEIVVNYVTIEDNPEVSA